LIVRKDTQVRLPVRCIDAEGEGVAGMLPADITDGTTGGNVTIVKGDGTLASIVLVNNTNWFEIHATKAPGLYHVVVPSSATNVLGTLQLCVLPAAADFLSTVITAQVEEITDKIDDVQTTVDSVETTVNSVETDVGTIGTQVSTIEGQVDDLWEMGFGKWKIFTSGADANRMVFYKTDNSVLVKFNLTDALDAATYVSPFTRTPV
jgi:hypothetical protein